MTFQFEKKSKRSLEDIVYQEIKRAIIGGKIQPGEYIREVDISNQMGISRGPIREAMSRLDQEGLVFSHPYRGTIVLETSSEEMEDIFIPTRRIVELYAAKHAYKRLTKKDYEVLKSLVDEMNKASNIDSIPELTNLDIKFHTYLIQKAASPTVFALWNNIVSRIHARMLYQGIHHKYLETVVEEHTEYLRLIKSGDTEKIKAHLLYHVY